MEINCTKVNSSLLVNLKGEFDLHTTNRFKERLDKKIAAGNKRLILNFGEVKFIDSSGIGAILSKYKQIKNLGGELVITNVKPQVQRIFEVSGVLRVIDIYSSEKEAIKSITGE